MAVIKISEMTELAEAPASNDQLLIQDVSNISSSPEGTAKYLTIANLGVVNYADATANFTGTLQNAGSNVVVDTDIGSSVEAYSATTALYTDTTANFTGTLQNAGSNVVVDTDIGSTVEAYDAAIAAYNDATANFTGTLQNGGSNVLVDSDIGVTAQAYDANLTAHVAALTLPTVDGTNGQVLATDGAGNVGFVDQITGVTLTADGAITAGAPVIINSDGSCSAVDEVRTIENKVQLNSISSVQGVRTSYDSTANKTFCLSSPTANLTGQMLTVTGSTLSSGTPTVIESAMNSEKTCYYDTAQDKTVVFFRNGSNNGKVVVGTVSGTTVSFGTQVTAATTVGYVASCYDETNQKGVIFYEDNGNSGYLTARVVTVSGTTPSLGTAAVAQTQAVQYIDACYDAASGTVVVVYQNDALSYRGYACVGTVSGTTISFGTQLNFTTFQCRDKTVRYDSLAQKVLIAYIATGNSYYAEAVTGTVSGTTISFGTTETVNTDYNTSLAVSYDTTLNSFSGVWANNVYTLTISGTAVTASDAAQLTVENCNASAAAQIFDPSAGAHVYTYSEADAQDYLWGHVHTSVATTLTDSNFIGFAAETVADTQSCLVETKYFTNSSQTGLTAGQAYYVQPSGALSTTAGTPEVYAGTAISSTSIIVKG